MAIPITQADLTNFRMGATAPYSNQSYNDITNVTNGATAPYSNSYLNTLVPGSAPGGDPVDTRTAAQKAEDAARASEVNFINAQLGQLGRQQDVGLGNINNSYTLQGNRLNQQRGIAERNYKTSDQQNTQGYLSNRNNIMTNTRNSANALQRLLGMNGAGNSSAALEQAPYAAGLQGSQQLTGAQQTYGNNRQTLDNNWQDTLLNYNNSREDLDRQKYQQENSLKSSIAQTRANLLSRLGAVQNNTGPYESQINSLLSQITNLGSQFANPVLKAGDVSFNAGQQGQYTLGRGTAPVQQGGGAASDLDPTFLGLLAGEKRDEYGQPLI